MFKNAKIGDKVRDIHIGNGVIIEIDKTSKYSIVVKIGKFQDIGNYDIDNINPSLFWQEFEIPKEIFQKPSLGLEVNTKVIVWLNDEPKFKRYFKRFNEEGKIITFPSGKTSWTSTICSFIN